MTHQNKGVGNYFEPPCLVFLPLFKILPCYDFLFRFLRNETVLFSVQG